MHTKFNSTNLKSGDHLGDLGLDWMTLKWTSEAWGVCVYELDPSGGLRNHDNEHSDFIKKGPRIVNPPSDSQLLKKCSVSFSWLGILISSLTFMYQVRG